MISAEREQEIRKLIRAAQHNGNWEYVIDFEDVTDLLALCDEQKERIEKLERTLGDMWIDAQDFNDAKLFRVRVIEMIEHVHPPRKEKS